MNKPMNDHFRAAVRMAAILPNIVTQAMKYAQQRGILRELLAGLRTGAK